MAEKKLKITRKIDDGAKVFSIRIKEDTVLRLEEVAKQTNRSRNELISICLEYALDNIEFEK